MTKEKIAKKAAERRAKDPLRALKIQMMSFGRLKLFLKSLDHPVKTDNLTIFGS